MRLAGRPACPACRAQVDDAGFSVTDWTAIARSTRRTRHQPGLMKLKPLAPLLCPIHRRTRPGRSRRKDGLRPERIRAHQRPGHPAGRQARHRRQDRLPQRPRHQAFQARRQKPGCASTWPPTTPTTPDREPWRGSADQAPPRRLQPRRGQGLYRPSGDRAAGLHGQGDSHHRSEPDRPKCIPIPAFDRLGGLEEIRRTGRSELEILGRETRLQT